MKFKTQISKAYSYSHIGSLIRSFANDQIYIFNYHRIKDINFKTQFDEEVFGPDITEFKKQMLWLKRHFYICSENDFLHFVKSGERPNQPCAAVTFDDAYEDNYRLAFPVLRDLKIPAIFYVPTSAIETRRLGWWDQIAFIVKNSKLSEFHFRNKNYLLGPNTLLTIKQLLRLWGRSSAEHNKNFINELIDITNSRLPTILEENSELMTWAQVQEVAQQGITIGSHTHSHQILAQLSLENQKIEFTQSKIILEDKIQSQIQSIAYPCGQYEHFHVETKKLAQECGYKMGFSYLTGPSFWSNLDPFDIRRTCNPESVDRLDLMTSFSKRFIVNAGIYSEPKHFVDDHSLSL